jgi:hypothetical protein
MGNIESSCLRGVPDEEMMFRFRALEANGRRGTKTECLECQAAPEASASKHDPNWHSIYEPLGSSESSLRLLAVDESPTGEVSLQLLRFSDLEKTPPFIAVSYTWGSLSPTKIIHINGLAVGVRENLYNFIANLPRTKQSWQEQLDKNPNDWSRYARDEFGNIKQHVEVRGRLTMNPRWWRYLWIDALCIDQSSVSEKTHQVRIMHDIFSRADFVMIWLGTEADNSATAMRTIETMEGPAEPNDTKVDAIRSLLSRPYWTRLWIIQEVVLAREIILCCGTEVASASNLHAYLSQWDQSHALESTEGDHVVSHLFKFRSGPRNGLGWSKGSNTLSIGTLMTSFSKCECTEILDKVYGLLALVPPGFNLEADYSKSREVVHFNVLKAELSWIEVNRLLGAEVNHEHFKAFPRFLAAALRTDDSEVERLATELQPKGARFNHYRWSLEAVSQ